MWKLAFCSIVLCVSSTVDAQGIKLPGNMYDPAPNNNGSIYGPMKQCKKLDYAVVAQIIHNVRQRHPAWYLSAVENCQSWQTFEKYSTCQWVIDQICNNVNDQRDAMTSPFKP